MGRKARVEYEGAIYHVIQRGANREYIYLTAQHKDYMVEQLANSVQMDGVEIFAYVVMSNHYHVLLRTGGEPLSKVMHRINTRYARWYNHESERSGPVFDGRYKANPIQDERYLLQVVRYIHRNPVRAKLCLQPKDYYWSSDADYRLSSIKPGLVNCTFIMGLLGSNQQARIKEYNILMDTPDENNLEDTCLTGDEGCVLQCETKIIAPPRKSLDQILLATGVDIENYNLIKSGKRQHCLQTYKQAYAQAAIAEGYTHEEIGNNISISGSAVGKYLEKVPGTQLTT